jgi:hypothetical protein
MKKVVFSILVAAILAAGCSKNEEQVSLNDANSASKAQKAIEEKKVAAAPRADPSVPMEQYRDMNSGRQLMFAYLAADSMPVDYEKVAGIVSQDFRRETDEFKRRDTLNALKPGIDGEIAKAKQGRYYYMDIEDSLEKYDFDSKSFTIPAFLDSTTYRYFFDDSTYRLAFSNGSAFSKLKVADEELARTLESMRSRQGRLNIKVFFFAGATELGQPRLMGEITKLQILDRKGKVLAEI